MKWFKFEPQEEVTETESSSMLVYLSPEALKHAVIVDDFASFQDSPECIPGGRLLEVSRQYSYRLRQVADLIEESLDDQSLRTKNQLKRNFHEEIRPEKRPLVKNEDLLSCKSDISDQFAGQIKENEEFDEAPPSQQKLKPEQEPFKDLESLFTK